MNDFYLFTRNDIMSWLITVWLWILFLATALTIATPLIDRVLNDDVIQIIDTQLDNLEFFLWSNNLNTLLILLCTAMIFIVFRFAFSFFWWANNNQ